MTITRTALAAIALSAVLLIPAACGSSSDDQAADLATLSDTPTQDAQGDVGDPTATAEDPEAAMLAFTQCMRDNGIPEFPDPVVESDGTVRLDFPRLHELGVDTQSDEFTSAVEACGDAGGGVTLGGGRFGDNAAETEDTLLALAECMRDNGVPEFPDPDLGGGGRPFADGVIDLDDQRISEAFEQCSDEVNLPDNPAAQSGGRP